MKNILKTSVVAGILFILTFNVYAQKLKVINFKKNINSDNSYSLSLTVELYNSTTSEIILPNPIPSENRNSFKLSNITSLFFYLKSEDDIFLNDEFPPTPEEYELPKLRIENLVIAKPKSSVIFEINTNNFEYNGVMMTTDKNPKISLVYDPKLNYLTNKKLYLDENILTTKFYENKIESNVIQLK
jgi:hypothetical protein